MTKGIDSRKPNILTGMPEKLKNKVEETRKDLQAMAKSVRPTVETARNQLIQYLQKRVREDWRAHEQHNQKFELEHYILALGDPLVDNNKHLLDKRFIYVRSGEPYFFGDNYHVGSVSYALLRAKVDRKKRVSAPGGKTMTIEEVIFYPLEHLEHDYTDEGSRAIKGYDAEWLVLLAVESLKSGRQTQIKFHNESGEIPLETLVQSCRDEFYHIVDPKQLDDEAKKRISHRMDREGGLGTCDGLHALHAIFAYAVLKNDSSQIDAYCNTIFSIIEYLKKPETQRIRIKEGPQNNFGYIAHLLTPLTELPDNYPLNDKQQDLIRWAVGELITQIESSSDLSMLELPHAIDVLKHMPDKWVR